MSIDSSKIGVAAAELMEAIERDHPEGKLVDVIVIAEIGLSQADDGSHDYAAFRWAGSSKRASVDAGLCAQALEGLTTSHPPPDDD
jgi:hypothetical protein